MKNKYILLSILLFILVSCHKEENNSDLLIRSWIFSEKPKKNTNNYQGYIEDRSIFDGSETITFKSDSKFFVNSIEYGSWSYDKNVSSIIITQTPYQEYTCCGIGETIMVWDIQTLTKDELIVNHSYYKYLDNQYKFE